MLLINDRPAQSAAPVGTPSRASRIPFRTLKCCLQGPPWSWDLAWCPGSLVCGTRSGGVELFSVCQTPSNPRRSTTARHVDRMSTMLKATLEFGQGTPSPGGAPSAIIARTVHPSTDARTHIRAVALRDVVQVDLFHRRLLFHPAGLPSLSYPIFPFALCVVDAGAPSPSDFPYAFTRPSYSDISPTALLLSLDITSPPFYLDCAVRPCQQHSKASNTKA